MGCAEYLNQKDWESIYLYLTTKMDTINRYGAIMQGNLGEEIANDLAINHLGMTSTGFIPVKHGIDGVFIDENGRTVVMDSKSTAGNPFQLLHPTNSGVQLTNSWISMNADLMQREASSQCVGLNKEIGEKVQQAIDDKSVRCILVHTNPETQEVKAYERISEDNVRSASSWREINWKE